MEPARAALSFAFPQGVKSLGPNYEGLLITELAPSTISGDKPHH